MLRIQFGQIGERAVALGIPRTLVGEQVLSLDAAVTADQRMLKLAPVEKGNRNGRDTLRISAACCVVSIWLTGTRVTASPWPT